MGRQGRLAGPQTDLCPRNNNQPTTVTLENIPVFEERHVNSIINTSSHARGAARIYSELGIKWSDQLWTAC